MASRDTPPPSEPTWPLDGDGIVYHQQCPWCRKVHSSSSHGIDWYFACCGHTRLVWRSTPTGLELQPVEEDMNDE